MREHTLCLKQTVPEPLEAAATAASAPSHCKGLSVGPPPQHRAHVGHWDGQSSTLRAQHPPKPCVPPPGCSRRRPCTHCAPQNAALLSHPLCPNGRKSPEGHPILVFSSKECCTCGFQSQLSPVSAARAALVAPGWYFWRHKQRLQGSVFANAGNQSQRDTSCTLVLGLKPMGTIPGEL